MNNLEWAIEHGYDPDEEKYEDAGHGLCEFCGQRIMPEYVDDSGVVYAYDCVNPLCPGEEIDDE